MTAYTAADFLAAYEPATVALMATPVHTADLSADTAKAHAVAAAGGLPVNPEGAYPALVWFAVYP